MAVTRYETRADATNEVSFVELWPWTGRKHQLRVHCAEVLKAPILGDDKYGSREAFDRFELMLDSIDNLHLHCRSLEIPHPIKENQRYPPSDPQNSNSRIYVVCVVCVSCVCRVG